MLLNAIPTAVACARASRVSPSGDYQVSRLSCEPGAMYDAIIE